MKFRYGNLASLLIIGLASPMFGQSLPSTGQATRNLDLPDAAPSAQIDVAKTEELIRSFSASQNVDDFRRVVDAVEGPFYANSAPREGNTVNLSKIPPSSETIKLWLEMYAALDRAGEQLAKELKPVYTKVYPPGEAGIMYAGPVSPSEIQNPVLRKEYEDAIAENKKNLLLSNNFAALRNESMTASSFFWLWANGLYLNNPSAQEAIASEASSLDCEPSRVQWIKTIVSRKGSPPLADPTGVRHCLTIRDAYYAS